MPQKIRVAFFGDDFSRRGKGTALVVRKLAEGLTLRHSNEIEVILLRPPGACFSPVCDAVQSVIIPRRFSTLLSYFWFFLTHRARYDVIVFNRFVYPGFWFLNGGKKILIAHDASVSEVYTVPRTGVNYAFEYVLRFVGQYFLDIVIGDSNNAKKCIAAYYKIPARKMRSLPLSAGNEYKKFDDDAREASARRLFVRYGLQSPYILDVSRFDPHKNIDRVLDAFFSVKTNARIPHMLAFVGGAHTVDYSGRMIEKVRGSQYGKDVTILNYVEEEDMPALYNCADMLVYPSLIEGFGLPILEAMKCGTPVITSNISSMPEVAGGAALLVDPLQTESIAQAMQTIMKDSAMRSDLIQRGLKRSNEFSWDKTVDKFVEMLR